MAKTLAHSSYLARVPRLYNVCELDFLRIYCFANDFCLDPTVFVFRHKEKKQQQQQRLISGDYSFALFQVSRTLNDFLNGGSNYKWSTNFKWIRMISLLDGGWRVGPVFVCVINRKHSFFDSFLFNLTLCWFSMRLSCCVKSLNDGLSSGSLCQQFIMIWYLKNIYISSVFQVHLTFWAVILFIS